MVSAQRQPESITPAVYLERERLADFKSEYLDGQVYAMAGGSPEHSAVTINTTVALGSQLRNGPCQMFSNDLKVATVPDGLYAYPDLSIVCGEPEFLDTQRDVLLNPKVLVEVLSPTTEAYDRGRKFARYQFIAAFTDYLLISQEEPRLELFSRQEGDQWLWTAASGLDSLLTIDSIGCRLPLAELYLNVRFPVRLSIAL